MVYLHDRIKLTWYISARLHSPWPNMREGTPAQDGDFSEQRFRDIVNAFLANSVGNLLNRTLGLLRKNCAGTLPAAAASVPADNPLRAVAELEVSPLNGTCSAETTGSTL